MYLVCALLGFSETYVFIWDEETLVFLCFLSFCFAFAPSVFESFEGFLFDREAQVLAELQELLNAENAHSIRGKHHVVCTKARNAFHADLLYCNLFILCQYGEKCLDSLPLEVSRSQVSFIESFAVLKTLVNSKQKARFVS